MKHWGELVTFFRPRTVSQRMFLITAVSLMPVLLIGVSTAWTVKRDRLQALHRDAYQVAELAVLEMAQIVSGAENALLTTAAMPVVKSRDSAQCSPVMDEVVRDLLFLSAIIILDEDGSVRCASASAAAMAGFGGSDLVAAARASGVREVGAALEGAPRTLPVARRIGGTAGAPPGVGVAFVDLDWLQIQIADRSMDENDSLTVVDRTGMIIARVPQPDRFVGTRLPETVAWILTAPKPGTVAMTSQDGQQRVLGYFPPDTNPSGVYVSAGKSVPDGMAMARSVAATSTLVGVGGAIIAVLVAIYLTQVFLRTPVSNLIRTVSAWRLGNTTVRTGMRSEHGEICAAGETLDAFMDELKVSREARQKAEEDREVLRDELDHRVRNLLATVQAVVRQTFDKAGNEAALKVFSQRLAAIGEANALLKQASWDQTMLRAVIEAATAPFAGPKDGRITLQGPDCMIHGNVVVAFSIALHELCTNAAKYGALLSATGTVSIHWGVMDGPQGEQFCLTWQEVGGPSVTPPTRSGFGSKVVRIALASYVGGTVDMLYEPSGLVCKVLAPRDNVIVPQTAAGLPMAVSG